MVHAKDVSKQHLHHLSKKKTSPSVPWYVSVEVPQHYFHIYWGKCYNNVLIYLPQYPYKI